jgi:hypothetical protein
MRSKGHGVNFALVGSWEGQWRALHQKGVIECENKRYIVD